MEKETIEGLAVNSPEEDNFIDVMVVGGGISGIQAALDSADTGFRVYLVDKAPAIGGKMIKPFPPMTAPCVLSRQSLLNAADIPILRF